mgnify:CR=1 FL=1
MKLQDELIFGGLAKIDEIGAYLDGLTHDQRVREVRDLSAEAEAKLWELAAPSEPLTLDFFVGDDVPTATEVIHDGWNSLPAFRPFQKRFCRSTSANTGESTIFGYNHNPQILKTIGITPGYFVTRNTAGLKHWERRGAVVVDYHLTPDGPVAPGWPRVKPNTQGLQKLVFSHTRDFMRRVSKHVSIGAAWKWEKAMGAYFVLCRRD